jgi:hypothetical protein
MKWKFHRGLAERPISNEKPLLVTQLRIVGNSEAILPIHRQVATSKPARHQLRNALYT